MGSLKIETVENGFIVTSFGDKNKLWAFESAKSMALFIGKWGNGKEKTTEININIDGGARNAVDRVLPEATS